MYNLTSLPRVLLVAIVVMLFTMAFAIIRRSMLQAFPAYIGTLAAILIIYGAYCLGLFKKYDLIGAYSIAVLFYMLSIYLSIFRFQKSSSFDRTSLLYNLAFTFY